MGPVDSKQQRAQDALQRLGRLETYLQADADNPAILGDAFRAALLCGEWDRAKAFVDRAQKLLPGDAAWALREGDLWLAQKRYPQAKLVLQRLAVLTEPGTSLGEAVAHNLAYCEFSAGDYATCATQLEPLVSAPAAPQAEAGRDALEQLWLRTLHRLGDLDKACQWAAGAEAAGRLSAGAAGVAALAALDLGDFAAAQRWSRLASGGGEAPTMESLVAQSSLALAARQPAPARKFADAALAINPEDGRAWSARGFADLLAGDLAGAAQGFERALAFMPQHIGTWHGLGWAQVLLRDLGAARASFERALELDRNFAESHGGLAVVLALQGQMQTAREHIEVAQRLDRGGLSGRYAQAIISGEAGDEEAIRRLAGRLLGERKAPLGGSMGDWLPPAAKGDAP